MAQRSEVAAIYTAGMIQGLALVASRRPARSSPVPSITTCPARNMAPFLCPRRSRRLVRRCWGRV